MHADMTAVTMQAKKTVSNEVHDSQVLLEPADGKNKTHFVANPIIIVACLREQT